MIAIDYVSLCCEEEEEVVKKATLAKVTIESLTKTLRKEKPQVQRNNIQKFARNMPDLSEVTRFLNDAHADRVFSQAVEIAEID